MKYGVHKIWFYYTDEWYATDDNLAPQIGVFDTLEEAEAAKEAYEIKAIKNMGSYDYIRDLTGFFDHKNHRDVSNELLEYGKQQGWHDSIRKREGHGGFVYYEMGLPQRATPDQLKEIIRISGAYFCKIIKYEDVKKISYIKFNHEFWGTKIFRIMQEDGILEARNPYISGEKQKGKYYVQKPPKGRKSASIKDVDIALQNVVALSLRYMNLNPEYHWLGKKYFTDWSDSPITLKAYINGNPNILLHKEKVDTKNIKRLTSRLKKQKSTIQLQEGDSYLSVSLKHVKAILGFFDLLKVKPFEIFEVYKEVNGKSVVTYMPESGTF